MIDYENEIAKEFEKENEDYHAMVSDYSNRLFDNKICVVGDEKFNYHSLKDNFYQIISEDEDMINAQIRVSYKVVHIDDVQLYLYFIKEKGNRRNEVNVDYATNLSEFISKIINIKSIEDTKCVYRGHGNWKFDLTPSIYRPQYSKILNNESGYIREIVATHPEYFEGCKSAIDYLAVLQHHGFPTRLLDFTENPLIALYMACASDLESNADVIRMDIDKKYYKFYDSDTVSVISNIAFTDDDFDISGYDFGEYANAFGYTADYSYNRYGEISNENLHKKMIEMFNDRHDIKKLIHQIREEKPFFKGEIEPEHLEQYIVLVKPRQKFARLTKQSGLFALFGIDKAKKKCAEFEFQNLRFKSTHIIIPNSCKEVILKELERININRATVYGDMDNITKYYIEK